MATEIVVILDRSGSMSGLEKDVIGGFNAFLNEQKKLKDKAYLTTVLFDNEYKVLYDRVNIKDAPELTSNEYYPRGTTALLDAVGKTINTIKAKVKNKSKVLFIINTDGYENSSVEFKNASDIKEMVKEREDTGKWKFMFFGAGIDAFGSSLNLGISTYANYTHTNTGTVSAYRTMSGVATTYRDSGTVSSGEYQITES